MRKTAVTSLLFILAVQISAPAVASQQKATHPAFTLLSRVSVKRPDGKQEVSESIRHVSSDGGVRAINKNADGSVSSDYLYEAGRGGFYVRGKDKVMVKAFGKPPEASGEPLPTAESLRADSRFAGTAQLLGYTTYIIRKTHPERDERDRDEYYAPELGWTPLKTVRYSGGAKFVVSEPVSVTFGEPETALMKSPEGYEMRLMAPISGGVLNGKAISKPAPAYPADAKSAGASGTVTVLIVIAEDGTVESAQAASGHPLLLEAAVKAAQKARFSPTFLSGQPVKVKGVVTYNFVLP
jgi:TonB family protein